jgi:phosphoribosyl 1,2-cyclic phosphate phosphodiesterase
MTFTFLGTGTSQGVPLISCKCKVCLSHDKLDKRLRSSLLVQSETTTLVIDTGPDFRYQMLREKIDTLDAILFTHSHKDHVAGLDDVRAFNYTQQKVMDVFANNATQKIIRNEFAYAFSDEKYPGVPEIKLHSIDKNSFFKIGDIDIQCIEVMHHKMPVLGFRINDFTYITDANFIDEHEMKKIIGSKYLVLNALRSEQHISHFTLQQAIEIAKNVDAKETYFTHISHQLGLHEEVSKQLPDKIFLAYDGKKIHY